jgi:ornithine cyclodeaminase
VVFDAASGQRLALLDGPTVTARRTAAVSLLAAQQLAPQRDEALLIVGAGVQGRAISRPFMPLSTCAKSGCTHAARPAPGLVAHARQLGLQARLAPTPMPPWPTARWC